MIHYVKLPVVNPHSDYPKTHGLKELFIKLGNEDRFHLLDRVEMTDEQLVAAATTAYMQVGKLVLAIENTKLLGFICTTKRDPGCISGLYVIEERRRQGIGKELVRQIKEMISGSARVNTVINNKEAQLFYQSLGFIPITIGMTEIN
jgi:ribosomal protein S18 acetylase RimI-like enzyme